MMSLHTIRAAAEPEKLDPAAVRESAIAAFHNIIIAQMLIESASCCENHPCSHGFTMDELAWAAHSFIQNSANGQPVTDEAMRIYKMLTFEGDTEEEGVSTGVVH